MTAIYDSCFQSLPVGIQFNFQKIDKSAPDPLHWMADKYHRRYYMTIISKGFSGANAAPLKCVNDGIQFIFGTCPAVYFLTIFPYQFNSIIQVVVKLSLWNFAHGTAAAIKIGSFVWYCTLHKLCIGLAICSDLVLVDFTMYHVLQVKGVLLVIGQSFDCLYVGVSVPRYTPPTPPLDMYMPYEQGPVSISRHDRQIKDA